MSVLHLAPLVLFLVHVISCPLSCPCHFPTCIPTHIRILSSRHHLVLDSTSLTLIMSSDEGDIKLRNRISNWKAGLSHGKNGNELGLPTPRGLTTVRPKEALQALEGQTPVPAPPSRWTAASSGVIGLARVSCTQVILKNFLLDTSYYTSYPPSCMIKCLIIFLQ